MSARELDALAAKVEQLTGPDRELDIAVGFAGLGWSWGEDGFGGEYLNIGAPNLIGWRQAIDPVPDCVPSPTGSVDVAMMLMPEDAFFVLDTGKRHDTGRRTIIRCEASVGMHRFMDSPRWLGHGCGTNPALALTAAALRSRASDQQP